MFSESLEHHAILPCSQISVLLVSSCITRRRINSSVSGIYKGILPALCHSSLPTNHTTTCRPSSFLIPSAFVRFFIGCGADVASSERQGNRSFKADQGRFSGAFHQRNGKYRLHVIQSVIFGGIHFPVSPLASFSLLHPLSRGFKRSCHGQICKEKSRELEKSHIDVLVSFLLLSFYFSLHS